MFYLWASDRRGRLLALYPGWFVSVVTLLSRLEKGGNRSPGYLICNAERTEFLQVGFSFSSFVSFCLWHPSQDLAYKFNSVVEAITFQDSAEGSDFLESAPFPSFIVRADTLETLL